jgi:hypothetical protein
LVLPLRARAQAPVNWGNAADWNQLGWLVSGQMYWSRLGNFGWSYLVTGLRAWSHFIVTQLGVVGLLLVFVTLAVLLRRSRLFMASCWMVVACSALSILYYSPDSNMYLIPALIALSLWMGLGAGWIFEMAALRSAALKYVAAGGICAFVVGRAVLAIPAMDLSKDRTASDFAQGILAAAPPQGIILMEGDEATFALWYFHYALGERPDLAVVSGDLLVQPWYHEVLRYTYPDLVVPAEPWTEALRRANPGRIFCEVPSILQPGLVCSPLSLRGPVKA